MKSEKNDVLAASRAAVRELVEEAGLIDTEVTVLGRPLSPEEAIGKPGRRDYPIVLGKERVVECSVLGKKGHAFTDSPRELIGTLREVLALELDSSGNRAIFVATLNAVLAHLGRVTGTVHCKDDDPELCAKQIGETLKERHGAARVGLIGLNPAIAEELVRVFGADQVKITDLNATNVGAKKFGVEVWDGVTGVEALAEAVDVVVVTGTTLVNGTFEGIRATLEAKKTPFILFGVTGAGVCALQGLERICPYGRDG